MIQAKQRTGPRPGALVALAAFLLAAPALAQRSTAGVKAYLTSGVVKLGDQVTLVVTVENAREARLATLPDVEGLEFGAMRGPSVQRTDSFVNGRRTSRVEHTWLASVRPLGAGEYVIPRIELVVDGRRVQTPELTLTAVQDLRGAELGLFEIRASSTRVVEGEPFSVELIVGFDAGLVQRINYVNLSLPWWDQLAGALDLEAPGPTGQGTVEFELNSRERVRAEQLPSRELRGREFVAFRLVRSYLPTRSGKLEFPKSFVEFGEVDQVRDFFRTERRKVETWFVSADPVAIEVVPLPERGRPVDFTGAIGSIAVKADAEPRDVDAGDSIKFTVEWSGAGNLEFFAPPDPSRLDAFRGFRVYGMTEESKDIDRRRVTYDLAPLTSEASAIPPLPLVVYDPELGEYTAVATEPIAIRVRALENPAGLTAEDGSEEFARDVRDIVARPAPPRDRRGPGGGLVAGLVLATPLAWLGLRSAVRRGRDPDAPLERRRRRARRELRRALAASGDAKAQLDALLAFLAARTREPDPAWTGRDLERFAESTPEGAGVDAQALGALGELVADLERAAYGGAAESVAAARIESVADELVRGGL